MLDTNKVNGMRQKKVFKFSAPGSQTPSILLKNPERVTGEEQAGGIERQPGARGDGEAAKGKDTKWAGG